MIAEDAAYCRTVRKLYESLPLDGEAETDLRVVYTTFFCPDTPLAAELAIRLTHTDTVWRWDRYVRKIVINAQSRKIPMYEAMGTCFIQMDGELAFQIIFSEVRQAIRNVLLPASSQRIALD